MDEIQQQANRERRERRSNQVALEMVFLAVIALVVIAAFIEALSYKLVSSRTPFVIMVPLLVLIAIHAWRMYQVRLDTNLKERLNMAFTGQIQWFNKVVALSGWCVGMFVLILAFGHFAGIFLFMLILMRLVARERFWLSFWISLGTTAVIYVTFEIGFNIEMWKGYLYRWYAGYRDF